MDLTLAFDTSAAYCAAVLLRGDQVIGSVAEEMTRGQAERLMPLLEGVLADAGVAWRDLGRIGVGIGPGNFTGIRIAVSAARGLALGLDIPAIGVSTLEAVAFDTARPIRATVPAPRGQCYVQGFGCAPDQPETCAQDALPQGAPILAPPAPVILAGRIARIAAARAPEAAPLPAPLYLRAADAAPARDAPPRILP